MLDQRTVICQECNARDHAIYVTGCSACGETRLDAAKRVGVRPNQLVAGIDFVPNTKCRAHCPTGHGTH